MNTPVIRAIAPLTTGIYLAPGASVNYPEEYAELWRKAKLLIESSQPADQTTKFEHFQDISEDSTDRHKIRNRYQSLDCDSVTIPPHFIHTQLSPQAASFIDEAIFDAQLTIYDHGVAVLEYALDPHDVSLDSTTTAFLESRTQQATQRLIKDVVEPFVLHLHQVLRESDIEEKLLELAEKPEIYDLWTARAIFATMETFQRNDFAHCWLREAQVTNDEICDFLSGKSANIITWVNYAIATDSPLQAALLRESCPSTASWDGLRYAQFYYASLELIDEKLSHALARTQRPLRAAELVDARTELTKHSYRAQLIEFDCQHNRKYFRRAVNTAMTKVLDGWQFEELVAAPVRSKIATCSERIQQLSDAQSRRASVWTDLILLGIAITSILGTALSVVSFGRSIGTESSMAGYDSGTTLAIEWIAAQPADAVLLSSFVASIGVAAIYLIYRQSSR